MPKSVIWEGDEGQEIRAEINDAGLPISHWFCHRCKAHFGVPVFVMNDPGLIYRCPACGSIQIEQETSRSSPKIR